MSRAISCLVVLGALSSPGGVSGATLHVPSEYSTIQAAIDSAAAGDTVLVACGTYYEHDIVMESGVCLRSETGEPGCVTIDAEQQGRVLFFYQVDSTATLEGITIRGGLTTSLSWPSYVGAGVYCGDASPVLRSCTFTGNSATGTYGSGGGLGCQGTSGPRVESCVFLDNHAVNGGGAACFNESHSQFLECTFRENGVGHPCGGSGAAVHIGGGSATFANCAFLDNVNGWGSGGGLACQGGTLVLTGCTLLRNGDPSGTGCTWWGGGLSLYSATAMVTDCVFSENQAAEGGGINCRESTAVLRGCTISENTVSGEGWLQCGGGICCQASQVTIEGCTFVADSAPAGGEICCADGTTLTIENTIIAFSRNGEALARYQGICDVNLACCDIFGNAGGDWVDFIADQYGVDGNFSADPLFCDPDNGDYTIAEDSPCAAGNHPDDYECGLIGALDVGCDPSRVERTTWGGVKALYR